MMTPRSADFATEIGVHVGAFRDPDGTVLGKEVAQPRPERFRVDRVDPFSDTRPRCEAQRQG